MRFIIFLESTNHENQARNILIEKGIENPEEVLQWIKGVVGKENKKYFPLVAFFYSKDVDKNLLTSIFQNFLSIDKNQLSFQVTKRYVIVKKGKRTEELKQDELLRFSEIVDAALYSRKQSQLKKQIVKHEKAGKHIISRNNIHIYMPENALDASILGKNTNFCISKFGSPYYRTYRMGHQFTIYFIFDQNRTQDDPLHIVVYTIKPSGEILLTDYKNDTGTISHPYDADKRGDYTDEYIEYLKEHGINPYKYLKYVPLTHDEKYLLDKYKYMDEVEFFDLSPEEMKEYISIGGEIGEEHVEYLIKEACKWYRTDMQDVLKTYFYTGEPLSEELFQQLLDCGNKQLTNHYLRYRIQHHNQLADTVPHSYYLLRPYEFYHVPPKERKEIKFNDSFLNDLIRYGYEEDAMEFLFQDKKIYKKVRESVRNLPVSAAKKLIDFWDISEEDYIKVLTILPAEAVGYFIKTKMKNKTLNIDSIYRTIYKDQLKAALENGVQILIDNASTLSQLIDLLGAPLAVEKIKQKQVKLDYQKIFDDLYQEIRTNIPQKYHDLEFVLFLFFIKYDTRLDKQLGWNEDYLIELYYRYADVIDQIILTIVGFPLSLLDYGYSRLVYHMFKHLLENNLNIEVGLFDKIFGFITDKNVANVITQVLDTVSPRVIHYITEKMVLSTSEYNKEYLWIYHIILSHFVQKHPADLEKYIYLPGHNMAVFISWEDGQMIPLFLQYQNKEFHKKVLTITFYAHNYNEIMLEKLARVINNIILTPQEFGETICQWINKHYLSNSMKYFIYKVLPHHRHKEQIYQYIKQHCLF